MRQLLVDLVTERGRVDELKARAADARGARCVLPKFSVFSQDPACPVYTWAVPKPRGSFEDFAWVWGAFVDQMPDPPLETDWRPEPRPRDPLAMLLEPFGPLSSAAAKGFFGESARPQDWGYVALKYAALSLHFEGALELQWAGDRLERVRGYMRGSHLIDVSAKGCYSEKNSAVVLPQYVPMSSNTLPINSLSLARYESGDAQAVAIMGMVEDARLPDCAAWMANFLLRAGVQLPWPAGKDLVRPRRSAPKRTAIGQTDAAFAAVNLLRRGDPHCMVNLFEILVPAAMTKKTFVAQFGKVDPDRRVKWQTQEGWIEKVIAISEGVDLAETG